MANELDVQNSSFGVKYTPAQLEMSNFDDMKEVVKVFSQKYHGLVFAAEDKQEATAARSELLDLRNAIETERKKVKKEYNKPLSEFESKIKSLTEMIDEPLNDIRDGLKQIDEGEREQRESHLNAYLTDVCNSQGLEVEHIEKDPRWLNKTFYTNNMKVGSNLKKEIQKEVDRVFAEKERYEENVKMLTSFCESKDIDPSGWLGQLDYKSPTEIMDDIHAEEKRQKEREEEKAKLAERMKLEEKETDNKQGDTEKEVNHDSQTLDDLEDLFSVDEQEEKVFVVYGSKQEIESVMAFMKEQNIKFDEQLNFSDLPF